MKRYRMRPIPVDAMQFDGSRASAEQLVAWMKTVAPASPVRPRLEYAGWDDVVGHLELEVMGMDHGAMAGDWVLVTAVDDQLSVWFVDDPTFTKYYEELEIDPESERRPLAV